MNPDDFVKKWRTILRPKPPDGPSERAFSQEHFIDLCRLLGHKTPGESDPAMFRFEKPLTKITGVKGFADVWKAGHFGWEYKGPHKDLQAAYVQIKLYTDAMENPPLLVVSDMERFRIHTNFTSSVATVYEFGFEDLLQPEKLAWLRNVFANPEALRPGKTREDVTMEVADLFSEVTHSLGKRHTDQQKVAHFLNRILFCMFAEDTKLIPAGHFTAMLKACEEDPKDFPKHCGDLFRAMAHGGKSGFAKIEHFNGGLFDNDEVLDLTSEEIQVLIKAAGKDWSNIEPAVFGTLFERGLDPAKRSQLGAHYTDPSTIMKIVRPVVIDPWQQSWEQARTKLDALMVKAKEAKGAASTKALNEAQKIYDAFLDKLSTFRVLDPACGSGNFLYLSLKALKEFEKRVRVEAGMLGLKSGLLFETGPENVMGIEINPYAAELARVSIWIGELQWMLANGYGYRKNPILRKLDQIENRDALLDADGTESQWPAADVIVGNPPFLGNKKMLGELGDDYVAALRRVYAGRVPGGADLVCFWFEKANDSLVSKTAARAGLVATQSIRAGASRDVLEHIAGSGHIFHAWSDEPWVNEGADVRVSLVAFARERGSEVTLDGKAVTAISPSLAPLSAGGFDSSRLVKVEENVGLSFQGTIKSGPFDVSAELARRWLGEPNASGRPNSDVIKRWMNGSDIAKRPKDAWVIDFGSEMGEKIAATYERPFEHVKSEVRPLREKDREEGHKARWWQFVRPRPAMRNALAPLTRYFVTPRVAKHRMFCWLDKAFLPDSRLYVFASDDDAVFGVLHSKIHEVWSLATCSWHGVGNDPTYNNETCFETFPFPSGMFPAMKVSDYAKAPAAQQVAQAAKNLDEARSRWLNPPEWVERVPEVAPGYPDRIVAKAGKDAELKKRTLTTLYNERPTWLENLHRDLDAAVAKAYGWPWPLSDEDVLSRLYKLNQDRAKGAALI